jgi:hypothetical protein
LNLIVFYNNPRRGFNSRIAEIKSFSDFTTVKVWLEVEFLKLQSLDSIVFFALTHDFNAWDLLLNEGYVVLA